MPTTTIRVQFSIRFLFCCFRIAFIYQHHLINLINFFLSLVVIAVFVCLCRSCQHRHWCLFVFEHFHKQNDWLLDKIMAMHRHTQESNPQLEDKNIYRENVFVDLFFFCSSASVLLRCGGKSSSMNKQTKKCTRERGAEGERKRTRKITFLLNANEYFTFNDLHNDNNE